MSTTADNIESTPGPALSSSLLRFDADAVIWSVPPEERAAALAERGLLVLMHGYGSNERDLAGLARFLPDDVVIASLRAPLPQGPGYAWFPITTPGAPEPQHIGVGVEAVLAWLDSLPPSAGVDLLGFSQGGAMVLQLLRTRPKAFGKGVVLSGFVAGGDLPGDATLAESKPPVFWGRDLADPVIAPIAIERTEAWLPEHATATVTLYPGVLHGISAEEIEDVTAFLQA